MALELHMASVFGISSPYLSSLFKKNHGESFLIYLRHVRVNRADDFLSALIKIFDDIRVPFIQLSLYYISTPIQFCPSNTLATTNSRNSGDKSEK